MGEKGQKIKNDPSFDIGTKTVACILAEGDETEKYKKYGKRKIQKQRK